MAPRRRRRTRHARGLVDWVRRHGQSPDPLPRQPSVAITTRTQASLCGDDLPSDQLGSTPADSVPISDRAYGLNTGQALAGSAVNCLHATGREALTGSDPGRDAVGDA